MNGSTTVNSSYASDGLVSGGISLGNLSPGQTLIIRFRAITDSGYLNNLISQSTNSRASATASNTGDDYDDVPVYISNTIQPVVYQSDRLSVQKLGKNITQGENAEKTSMTASPNDTLEFVIRIRSLYSSTLYNVTVVDVLPYGLSYINRTTGINGTLTSDSITGSGLNVGSLSPNQEIVVRFNALVNSAGYFSNGTTSITNTARISADNTSTVTVQLPISIVNGKVAGVSIAKVAGIATGTAGSLALSLFLSGIVTFLYMGYTKTGVFKKRDAWAAIRNNLADKDRFNFASPVTHTNVRYGTSR